MTRNDVPNAADGVVETRKKPWVVVTIEPWIASSCPASAVARTPVGAIMNPVQSMAIATNHVARSSAAIFTRRCPLFWWFWISNSVIGTSYFAVTQLGTTKRDRLGRRTFLGAK